MPNNIKIVIVHDNNYYKFRDIYDYNYCYNSANYISYSYHNSGICYYTINYNNLRYDVDIMLNIFFIKISDNEHNKITKTFTII